MGELHAVTKTQALAYRNGSKSEKSRAFDQPVELTGWHRDHARPILRQAGTLTVITP